MTIIYKYLCVIFLSQCTDLFQRGNISIHAEHTIRDDESVASRGVSVLQDVLKVGHVVVRVAVTLSLAQTNS